MLSRLPRNDEHVLALLTQLVASKAQVFAGTLFSTQRLREHLELAYLRMHERSRQGLPPQAFAV